MTQNFMFRPRAGTPIRRLNDLLTGKRITDSLAIIGISLILVSISLLLQGHIGVGLSDEGFLWYGSLRTGLGDIPMRDFNAYDPGRYYWTALWMKLLGKGIISFRISLAIFQFLGLSCGLLALSRVVKSRILLTAAGLVLLLWMFPRHKLFEPSIAMASVYVGVLLCERPSFLRHFIAGMWVGLAAFFGKNHGLYCFVGFLLIILFLRFRLSGNDLPRKLLSWAAGIFVGYSPMLGMILFVPGFAQSFNESITFLFGLGSTNLALPVPWPWRINFSQGRPLDIIRQAVVGGLFLVMPLYYIGAIAYGLAADSQTPKRRALFVASNFIGLGYMHYAFSRAEISHLAQGIHPLLLSIMAFPLAKQRLRSFIRGGIVAMLMVVSLLSVGLVSPYYQWASRKATNFEAIDIRGDKVLVDAGTAKVILAAERINRDFVKKDEQILIAPHWPMLYAVLDRKSPLWETYFIFSRPAEMQRKMIGQLEAQHTNWAIIGDVPLDGHNELRFRNTHRLLWEYLNRRFMEVDYGGLPANYRLLKRICNSP